LLALVSFSLLGRMSGLETEVGRLDTSLRMLSLTAQKHNVSIVFHT
jgi:hypothetical protein